jgi:cob(I)alamin adenosyltransferase
MAVYTKTGDKGITGLYKGVRKNKSEEIFDVLGTLDELNASLGLVRLTKHRKASKIVSKVQDNLFLIGAMMAGGASGSDSLVISEQTAFYEKSIDELSEKLPPLKNFILPGGSGDSAKLHYSRALCRRLERLIVMYYKKRSANRSFSQVILPNINRLSDLLFVLARYVNFKDGKKDVIWKKQT